MISDLLAPVAQRRDFALAIARAFGLHVTLTSGFRSSDKQAQLRAQYEACLARGETISPANNDSRCRYPANRPGDSSHEFGLGWDSSVTGGDAQWQLWTLIRQAVGFRVPDNDRVHAEVPDWRAIALQLYQVGAVPTAPIGATPPVAPVGPQLPPTVSYQVPPTAAANPVTGLSYPYTFQGASFRCVDGVPRFAPNTPIGPYLAGARCP